MIQAYFNQIRKKIIEEINNSNKDIIIAVAWFTQHDLFDAIINALERGVNISLILIKDIINCGDYGLDFCLLEDVESPHQFGKVKDGSKKSCQLCIVSIERAK